MKHYTVFDKVTGTARGHLSCADEQVAANTGSNDLLVEGRLDPHAHRLDANGNVIADSTRGVAHAAFTHRHAIMARIAELESNGHRALREAALGYDGAKGRLQLIDDQIIDLRTRLNGTAPASVPAASGQL